MPSIEEIIYSIPQFGKSKEAKKRKECQAKVFEEIRWHSLGIFPKRLVYDFRGNENLSDLERRKAIHQPITTNDYHRCLQGALEQIKSSDYTMSAINENTRIAANVLLDEIDELFNDGISDPNGLYAVLPKDVWSYEFGDDLNNFNNLEFHVYYLNYDQIDYVSNGVILSKYREADKNKDNQKILVNDKEIVIISDNRFSSLYEHNLGVAPIFAPFGIKGEYCYNSLIYPFIPEANIALQLFSDWLLGVIKNNYSTEIRREIDCVICDGLGVFVDAELTEIYSREVKSPCKTCNGKGKIIEPNPMGLIIIPDSSSNSLTQEINPKDFSAFIERPIEPVKYTDEKWRESLDNAIKNITPPKAKVGAESGESIKQQREKYETWIKTLGGFYFYIIESVTNLVDGYLNIESARKTLKITPPSYYDTLDADAKIWEINELKKNGSPFQARTKYQSFIEREYKYDAIKLKTSRLIPKFDVLFFSNSDNLIVKKASGVVTPQQCQKHEFASVIFMELEENEMYLDWTDEETINEANRLFNIISPPINNFI